MKNRTVPTRIVFLDFDGVLNTHQTWTSMPMHHRFDPDKVARISDLVHEVDAHIVISSAWREFHTLPELKQFLALRGFRNVHKRVIGTTPVLRDMEHRGAEIKLWLSKNQHVESFVILDDNDWMEGVRHRFVQTTVVDGLTEEKVAQAKQHLLRHKDEEVAA